MVGVAADSVAERYEMPREAIDWPSFLAKQDPVWERLPQNFDEGGSVGNGIVGLTVHQDGTGNLLRFDVGRTDVADNRPPESLGPQFGRCRLPIGYFKLLPVGKITTGTLRTDLWNAELSGKVETDKGTINFRALAHATEFDDPFVHHAIQELGSGGQRQPVIFIEFKATGDERDFRWEWQADKSATTSRMKRGRLPPGYEPNPPPIMLERDGVSVCEQPLLVGGAYATAWMQTPATGAWRKTLISLGISPRPGVARQDTADSVRKAVGGNLDTFVANHRAWWHAYYPESFISLPTGRVENYYWLEVYRFASATRANGVLLDTQGPWFRNTFWPMWWWDLNNETAYMPVYTANRLELGLSLVRWMDRNIGNFISNVKPKYRYDSAGLWANSGLDGRAPIDLGIEGLQPMIGCLPWACHNYWLQYRYSMDPKLLEHLYPILRRSINYYRHVMIRDKDGTIHLPVTTSPEYGNGSDCNYDLALFRWGCHTLLEAADRLDYDDPLIPEWKEILAKLTPYPADSTGLMIAAEIPFGTAHRHWSHMLSIFPLYILNWDQPENRALIVKSVDHWVNLDIDSLTPAMTKWAERLRPPVHVNPKGGGGLRTYSFYAASSMYSSMGNGDKAHSCLMTHLNGLPKETKQTGGRRGISANGMYFEGDPVIESSFSPMASIQNMLLQSWGDRIRVFGAMPSAWPNAIFSDLRAEGAFLVSAEWKNGKTDWIRIKSLAGEPCRVVTDLPDGFVVTSTQPDCTAKKAAPGLLEINLTKGSEVLLRRDASVQPVVKPLPAADGVSNYYGVKQ